MPHTGRISDKTGEKVPVLVDLQFRLKGKIERLEDELINIDAEISIIEDPLARAVGREKFLIGKTWQEVADKQGFATDKSCRQFFWYHWGKTFRHLPT